MPGRVDTRTPFPSLFPPTAPLPADISAERLNDWITTWSYLIEHDRVWNDSLLEARNTAGRNSP